MSTLRRWFQRLLGHREPAPAPQRVVRRRSSVASVSTRTALSALLDDPGPEDTLSVRLHALGAETMLPGGRVIANLVTTYLRPRGRMLWLPHILEGALDAAGDTMHLGVMDELLHEVVVPCLPEVEALRPLGVRLALAILRRLGPDGLESDATRAAANIRILPDATKFLKGDLRVKT